MKIKTGILLLNLGTPDSSSHKDVKSYLREFLSDPRVIDLPYFIRLLLVNILILPFRTKNSAHAYQQIWTEQGSPLAINSLALKEKLQSFMNDNTVIELGMRYGSPSIGSALASLNKQNCDHLIILPLFPQYSSAATGSAIEAVFKQLKSAITFPSVDIISDFFDSDWFIQPYAALIKTKLEQFNPDYVLFSYHGLPERQIEKSGCLKKNCDRNQACSVITEQNRYCYRAQCFGTTKALIETLNLKSNQFSTSFQSRLGRTPWIKPYTDEVLPKLYQQGVSRLAIACPSFTADCLESLEEIGLRAKDQWLSLGGSDFLLLPCLNADDFWVQSLSAYIKGLK